MNTHISTLDLNAIAQQINSEHEKLIAQVKRTAAHFIRLGELLTQAKGAMNHGEWTPWLRQNCSVGPEQARRYMRLYAKRDEIDQTGLQARFSIERTLKALSADPEPEVEETEESEEIILEGELASAEPSELEIETTESEEVPENGLEARFEESESKSEETVIHEPEAETEESDATSDVTPEEPVAEVEKAEEPTAISVPETRSGSLIPGLDDFLSKFQEEHKNDPSLKPAKSSYRPRIPSYNYNNSTAQNHHKTDEAVGRSLSFSYAIEKLSDAIKALSSLHIENLEDFIDNIKKLSGKKFLM